MINQQLVDFIKNQLLKGVDKETISKELLKNGWLEQDILEGFSNINSENKNIDNISSNLKNNFLDVSQQSEEKKFFLDKINFLKIFIVIVIISFIITSSYIISEVVFYSNGAFAFLLYRIYNIFNIFFPVFFLIGSVCFISYLIIYIKYTIKKDINNSIKSGKKVIWYFILSSILFFEYLAPNFFIRITPADKPVIYLYPTQTQKIKVELDYKGELIANYPAYDYSKKGWEVITYPDGKIINSDGKEYSYLFWEGKPATPTNYNLSTGFIVKGGDIVKFLQDTLSKMGLTPKEYNEFIVYWYPKMKDNKYNLIHFADKQYTDTAPLTITPTPDSMLRIFMVFKPLNRVTDIKPQEIKSFNRTGFSVIEWGGTELRK